MKDKTSEIINTQENKLKEMQINQIYELKYLIIPDWLYKSNLNATELKIMGFILSYNTDKLYFSNKQLSNLFNLKEDTISKAINRLNKLGYINLTYKMKDGGGQLRIITISDIVKNKIYGGVI